MNTFKVYCYAQHCASRNGGIVGQNEIDVWKEENPERVANGQHSDDWDLIAEGTEEEIVRDIREMLAENTAADSNAAFRRRQCRNVLEMLRRPETPAKMINRNAWEAEGIVRALGEEIDREEIDSEQPERVGVLAGWAPFTEVWRCGEEPEEYTYYIVSK